MKYNCSFNIRTLTAGDIFPMADIIAKCGLSDLKKIFTSIDYNADYHKVGISITIEMASIICANISKCKNDIIKFLENLSDFNYEQIENMPPAQFMLLIKSVINKEEFRDFFSVLSKLFLLEK